MGNGVSVMSGYRDRSNFDPYANPNYGRPLRPYNWVQWTGVGMGLAGLAIYAVYFAGRAGWMAQELRTPMFGFALVMFGSVLIGSRREIRDDPAPELAAARKRWLLIILAVSIAVFGAAIAIDFKGA